MEKLYDLAEYRNERLEAVKQKILRVARDELLLRTDGDYGVTFGKADISEITLHISECTDVAAPAPHHVVTETGVLLADHLAATSDLPYSVDLNGLQEKPPTIRIVKM